MLQANILCGEVVLPYGHISIAFPVALSVLWESIR